MTTKTHSSKTKESLRSARQHIMEALQALEHARKNCNHPDVIAALRRHNDDLKRIETNLVFQCIVIEKEG